MLDKEQLSMCSGCAACASICPKKCIQMIENKEGFLYPQINVEQCVNCAKCTSVCSNHWARKCNFKKIAYAAINRNENERLNSSSGGIFAPLVRNVLQNGGVVFAPAFDDALSLSHIVVTKIEDISRLMGSKYVQSNIGDTYIKIREFLSRGITAYFAGTPCQVSGLKRYIGGENEHLICQDVICHGVPSPLVWRKYVEMRISKDRQRPQNVSFRNKKYGWKNYSMQFLYNKKKYVKAQSLDPYLNIFFNNFSLRKSCYECLYKGEERDSDITLADFWGIGSIYPSLNDDRGTSLVIINSEKGLKLFEDVKAQLKVFPTNLAQALQYNSAYYYSTPCPDKRAQFFEQLQESGFTKSMNKYCNMGFLRKVKYEIVLKKQKMNRG